VVSLSGEISILYLGTRGAGSDLTHALLQKLSSTSEVKLKSLLLSGRNQSLNSFDLSQCRVFTLPKSRIKQTFFIYISLSRKKKRSRLLESIGNIVIIPMSSPQDFRISRMLQSHGVKVIRVIHDTERHHGEIWPNSIVINKQLNYSDQIILASNISLKSLHTKYLHKTIVIPNLSIPLLKDSLGKDMPYSDILFVGRMRSYKGIETLHEAWSLIQETKFKNLRLVIAGEGNIRKKKYPYVTYITRWLTSREIIDLIEKARVVVFPYTQASQSGLISIVQRFNKQIVISNLPILLEQCKDYPNTLVFEARNSHELAGVIQAAMTTPNVEFEFTGDDWIEAVVLFLQSFIK